MRPPIVRRCRAAPSRGQVAPADAGDLQVASVAAAPLGEQLDGASQLLVEARGLVRVERSAGPGRVEARPPQDLVGEQVADARDVALVEQPGLQRGAAGGEGRTERCRPHGQRVHAEVGDVRVEQHTTEPTGIDHAQVAAVGEPQREADPGRVVPAARVLELLDGTGPVDEQPTRHPEAQAEGGPVRVQEEQLADAAGAGDRRAR